MQKDFDLLLNAQSLGFYNCCELINIFIEDTSTHSIYNYLSLFVFEERIEPKFSEYQTYLTRRNLKINDKKHYNLGIAKKLITLEDARKIFQILVNSSNEITNIGLGDIHIGKFEKIRKIFISKESTVEPTLNSILKNNFHNGSYILEFFDISKPLKTLLETEELLNNAAKLIKEYIAINTLPAFDRIGNIIFQFPSMNVDVSYTMSEDKTNFIYNIFTDKRLPSPKSLQLITDLKQDSNTMGFAVTPILSSEDIIINVGNADFLCETTLVDTSNNLILHRETTTFIGTLKNRIDFRSPTAPKRTITESSGEVTEIELISPYHFTAGNTKDSFEEFITERMYQNSIEKIKARQEFVSFKADNNAEAIAYVIALMNQVQNIEKIKYVAIWDPYLSAKEIIETWYHSTTFNIPLKAITSNEVFKVPYEDFKTTQVNLLETSSNNYGINIEFRCHRNNHGYKFHDRFLLIVPQKDTPIVWSLGTSLNSIGKSHHIIQKVLHPQMIVDTFEDLWKELNHEDCIIWKRGI